MEYVKYPTSKQLAAELGKGLISKIYLFIGEEDGEKEKLITMISGRVFGENDTGYSSGRFHIELDEFMKAADFALSQSMFSDKKLCVMLNLENLQASAANLSVFNDMIINLPDSVVLIMTSSDNTVPKFIQKEILTAVKVYHFWRFFEKDLFIYIINSLKSHGVAIERDAAGLLVELLGQDIKKIDEALEKIIGYNINVATKDIISSLIHDEKGITIYNYIDALFKRDKKSLIILKKLIENNYPELVILNHIVRQSESIERFHNFLMNGLNEEDALKSLGISTRNRGDFIEYVKCVSPVAIKSFFSMFYVTDRKLKSRKNSKSILSNPLFNLTAEMIR